MIRSFRPDLVLLHTSEWPVPIRSRSQLLRMRFIHIVLIVLLLPCAVPDSGAIAERIVALSPETGNALFRDLIQRGVKLGDAAIVKLPAPVLGETIAEKQQREMVTQIAGRYGWERFVRKSTTAPFVLRQAYMKDKQGDRIGHKIDLWFVAHGKLEELNDQRFADTFMGPRPGAKTPHSAAPATQDSNDTDRVAAGRSASVSDGRVSDGRVSDGRDPNATNLRELGDSELERLGIPTIDRDVVRYMLVEFPLMKRVYLRGVAHVERSSNDESILIAWQLDPRSEHDGTLANRWYPIETTELGARRCGAARPYRGYGGYLQVTTLSEPQGALLFEVHVAFHEPKDWFHASNLLRSKTPLVVREQVDKVRRKLAKLQRSQSQ